MNEAKTLIKYIPCNCKCKFDGKNIIHIKDGMAISVDVSAQKSRKNCLCKEDSTRNRSIYPSTCIKFGKIIDNM